MTKELWLEGSDSANDALRDLVAQPAPDGWVAWSAAGAGGIVECVAQVTPGTPLPADMPHGSIARVTWAGVDGAADELILTRP